MGSNKQAENRLSLNLNTTLTDSGFSSLPPSTSSPTSSTSSPPESSSNHDSDSDQDKSKERRAKIVGRVKTKRIVNTPGWINKMTPTEPGE